MYTLRICPVFPAFQIPLIWRGPAQDVTYDIILRYVSKIIYLS